MTPTTANRTASQSGFLRLYDQLKQIVRIFKYSFEIHCYECDSLAEVTGESVVSTTPGVVRLQREVVCTDWVHQSSRCLLQVFAEDW